MLPSHHLKRSRELVVVVVVLSVLLVVSVWLQLSHFCNGHHFVHLGFCRRRVCYVVRLFSLSLSFLFFFCFFVLLFCFAFESIGITGFTWFLRCRRRAGPHLRFLRPCLGGKTLDLDGNQLTSTEGLSDLPNLKVLC